MWLASVTAILAKSDPCWHRPYPAVCLLPVRAAYHHGETSLATTIVSLAQDFVGSNNVNYLVPQGGWGAWAGRVPRSQAGVE